MDYFTHNTYAINYKMASFFLENAASNEKGKQYNIVSSILFSAFSLESYLNNQGNIEFNEEWEKWDSEKKPSFKEKLLKLTNTYKITLDFNQEPYSIIHPLFDFRNSIVHGRTETIRKNVRKPSNNSNGALLNLASSTEKFSNIKNAEKILSCTKEIIENLNSHSKNKIAESRLLSIGNGTYQVKRS